MIHNLGNRGQELILDVGFNIQDQPLLDGQFSPASSSDDPGAGSSKHFKTLGKRPIQTVTPILSVKDEKNHSISDEDREKLEGFLEINSTAYTDAKPTFQFTHRHDAITILDHIPKDSLGGLLTTEFVEEYGLSLSDIPKELLTQDLVLGCFKEKLPNWDYDEKILALIIDDSFEQDCLKIGAYPVDKAHQLISRVPSLSYEKLIDLDPLHIKYLPSPHQSQTEYDKYTPDFYNQLCIKAVTQNPAAYFEIPQVHITKDILKIVEKKLSLKLSQLPERFRTDTRCNSLISDCINILSRTVSAEAVPESFFIAHPKRKSDLIKYIEENKNQSNMLNILPSFMKTEDFCSNYLQKHPYYIQGCPENLLQKYPEWIERAQKDNCLCLRELPEAVITPDLVRNALNYHSGKSSWDVDFKIPEAIWRDHKDIRLLAARRGELRRIPKKFRTVEICRIGLEANCLGLQDVPELIRPQLPNDLLLAVAPEYIDQAIREAMLANGDTTLPTHYRSKPIMDREVLLTPISPKDSKKSFLCTASLFLKKIVMGSCSFFQLPNHRLGQDLKNSIEVHCQKSEKAFEKMRTADKDIKDDSIPFYKGEITPEWTRYGGRALMKQSDNYCSRLKFLREGENIKDFAREEAVQQFAIKNNKKLGLKSEIPKPVGLRFVPVEKVASEIIDDFKSTPEVVHINGQDYYLVYEFTTCDQTYSTLAHQKDAQGGSADAEEGLLKACHDLGVWSSLGALHASTIKAYHDFSNERRELFLAQLLMYISPNTEFPGVLKDWAGEALVESDWGYTGLRDLGDLVFYPDISEIFYSKSVSKGVRKNMTLPHLQRVAFLNTLCENMVAAILHYAKLHRDDPDYSYKKESEGTKKLAQFIGQTINTYLSKITGKQTTAQVFFESPDIYQEWLLKTAQETAMWTARQNLESDCFVRSLQETKRYPEAVYPDTGICFKQYPEDFTTHGKQNLGANNCPFGLTLLIRGLYQILAGLAVELSE